MYRNKMASQHDFSMVPRADIPRSKYRLQQNRRQTFNAGVLVPIYCEEILPGDHFKGESTIFARMATPITPVLDNAELETFFFFVPNRIVWTNWENFIGGGAYVVPKLATYGSTSSAYAVGSIYDHFGLPTQGQITNEITNKINCLPFRAYNQIYNEWFRDQNLTTAIPELTGDGPDTAVSYALQPRAKKHDYFTSCLPWPQKGTAVTLPLGSTAPVNVISSITTGNSVRLNVQGTTTARQVVSQAAGTGTTWGALSAAGQPVEVVADLSQATAATINAIRLAFQVQRLLERDARGGTRYTEVLQAHFGVRPPDFRLQRPEYIGGGKTMVNTNPIAQTTATGLTGGSTPLGNLAAMTTIHGGSHRFEYAATEHGYIIGLANVRTDLTYQQGIRRHWWKDTRYDFYWPALAHLGEQTVYNREIYCTGAGANDDTVFGYQERWAELRYTPNEITGLFRSTAAGTIHQWHYAEQFGSAPALNNTFITDPSQNTVSRSLAVGAAANGQQILCDILHTVIATRPLPTYSVPGLIDHF